LDPTFHCPLAKEGVQVDAVIHIEADSGTVKRVGPSDSFATEFDLEAKECVPLPKGDAHKKKQVVQELTLHDLDMAKAHPNSSGAKKNVLILVQAPGKPKKAESADELRHEINKVVNRHIDQSLAELVPGVLFVDEVHMLDMECFACLNRSLESTLSPIVIFAKNSGIATIRGTETKSPHGTSADLLDHMTIIPTTLCAVDEMVHICQTWALTDGMELEDDALKELGLVGARTSLRHAVQMLTPAKLIAGTQGRTKITPDDVQQVDMLFLDGKASAQMLATTEGFMSS
jgi:RuvB-like protein 1 (pontin 52)